jgi:hypothetical protein
MEGTRHQLYSRPWDSEVIWRKVSQDNAPTAENRTRVFIGEDFHIFFFRLNNIIPFLNLIFESAVGTIFIFEVAQWLQTKLFRDMIRKTTSTKVPDLWKHSRTDP